MNVDEGLGLIVTDSPVEMMRSSEEQHNVPSATNLRPNISGAIKHAIFRLDIYFVIALFILTFLVAQFAFVVSDGRGRYLYNHFSAMDTFRDVN
ncbi:hypothetical protein P9112_000693 [Eukaryota sp. TZLM1-RC]